MAGKSVEFNRFQRQPRSENGSNLSLIWETCSFPNRLFQKVSSKSIDPPNFNTYTIGTNTTRLLNVEGTNYIMDFTNMHAKTNI